MNGGLMNMNQNDFYLSCAISALQGLQESGGKLSIAADLMPKKTAKLAFEIADAMLIEAKSRGYFQQQSV